MKLNHKELRAEILAYDPLDEGSFAGLLQAAADTLKMGDMEMAELFDVSRPSVTRWRTRETLPRTVFRKLVKAKLSGVLGV